MWPKPDEEVGVDEVLRRLHAVEVPDHYLDKLVARACGFSVAWKRDTNGSYRYSRVPIGSYMLGDVLPRYTASLDAALTLVPEEWRTNWCGEQPDRRWSFELIARNENKSTDRVVHKLGAIALCIAALKARRMIEGEGKKAG